MKLAGLDFETANFRRGSICAAGCAILEDGVVTEKQEWLIRPHLSMDFVSERCFQVHQIGYFDLRQAPEFPEIWPALNRALRSADHAVIHNAPFDLSHLRAALELYRLPLLPFSYICSLAVSRERFPEMKSHSLDSVASYFDHSFKHHDALEDSIACATILFKMKFTEKDVKVFEICRDTQ